MAAKLKVHFHAGGPISTAIRRRRRPPTAPPPRTRWATRKRPTCRFAVSCHLFSYFLFGFNSSFLFVIVVHGMKFPNHVGLFAYPNCNDYILLLSIVDRDVFVLILLLNHGISYKYVYGVAFPSFTLIYMEIRVKNWCCRCHGQGYNSAKCNVELSVDPSWTRPI